MAHHEKTPHFGRELSEDELQQAGGGFSAGIDIDDWCGTKPPIRIPPRPGPFDVIRFDVISAQVRMR